MTEIGFCCWDGYETENKKCSLVTGTRIIKEKMNSDTIKIYAGNKCSKCYRDFEDVKPTTLKELFQSTPYTQVFDLNFNVIIIVAFSINRKGDDYWRTEPPTEFTQFREASEFLSKKYPNTLFILSNWESDCVLDIYSGSNHKDVSEHLISLINQREKATEGFPNVQIALEVNRFYDNRNSSIDCILPFVQCKFVSYSCYQTLFHSVKSLSDGIDKIRKTRPDMVLYIGEFGFPTCRMEKNAVLARLRGSINLFHDKQIPWAFYWNLYNNEPVKDGYNGYGLITPKGECTYVHEELMRQTSVFLVRHGQSLHNQAESIGLKYDKPNPELSENGKQAIQKVSSKFWIAVNKVAGKRQIRILVSPLRRAIQTCLLSLEKNMEMTRNVKIIITPYVTETGHNIVNKGELLEDLQRYPPLMKLQNLFPVRFEHIKHGKPWWNKYKPDKLFKYLRQRRYEWNNEECIVCFSHYNFILEISQKSLGNFGDSCFAVFNKGTHCYSSKNWVTAQLD